MKFLRSVFIFFMLLSLSVPTILTWIDNESFCISYIEDSEIEDEKEELKELKKLKFYFNYNFTPITILTALKEENNFKKTSIFKNSIFKKLTSPPPELS